MEKAEKSDRLGIQTVLELTGVFTSDEIQCALGLFDIYCNVGSNPDEYVFFCAYDDPGTVLGYVCYGKATLAEGVYDLYWIAVDPACQGMGIGALLMETLDDHLKVLGARMVLAETSSRAQYLKAHRLYERHQFKKISTISDYYSVGDDLLVYGKRYCA